MTCRVIQWATGHIGTVQLQEIIDRPDLDLVGVFVYADDKAGVDAGRLCHRPDTGVLATNNKDEILALDADVVLHAESANGDAAQVSSLVQFAHQVIAASVGQTDVTN